MLAHIIRSLAVFVIAWPLAHFATAADVKIGSVSLHFPPLPDHCEMDPVIAEDARLIASLHRTLLRTGSRLLMVTADCAELKEWRNGKRPVLGHMAQYQTVLALESGPPPDAPETMVKRYCEQMDAMAEKSMPGTRPDAQERAEEASRLIRAGQMRHLGVVAQEPLACYASTLHKFTIANAGEFTQATVIATTIVKERIVVCYLSAPYAGRETIAELFSKQRANVRQLQRANP